MIKVRIQQSRAFEGHPSVPHIGLDLSPSGVMRSEGNPAGRVARPALESSLLLWGECTQLNQSILEWPSKALSEGHLVFLLFMIYNLNRKHAVHAKSAVEGHLTQSQRAMQVLSLYFVTGCGVVLNCVIILC